MKKSLLIIVVLLGVLFIAGCGNNTDSLIKNTPEKKFCDDLKPTIENYRENRISYDELYSELKSLYNKYCIDETSTFCSNIKVKISTYDTWNSTDHNCSQYGDGSTMRTVCDRSVALHQSNLDNKTDADILNIECQSVVK